MSDIVTEQAGTLKQLMAAYERLADDLREQANRLEDRVARARQELEQCAADRQSLVLKQEALAKCEDFCRVAFADQQVGLDRVREAVTALREIASGGSPMCAPQKRARLGPQRLQMFMELKRRPEQTQDELSLATGLSSKRIREQMACDCQDGLVLNQTGRYSLTMSGLDLLDRYHAIPRGVQMKQD